MREFAPDVDGLPLVHDAIGMIVRGDAIIVLHEASAALNRSHWLFSTFERLPGSSYVVLLVIGDGAKPPDQALREHDSQAFSRVAYKLRRIVTVSEGGSFRASFVRLVMNTYALFIGERHIFAFAENRAQALEWLQKSRSPVTPPSEQLEGDLAQLRHALQQAARISTSPT